MTRRSGQRAPRIAAWGALTLCIALSGCTPSDEEVRPSSEPTVSEAPAPPVVSDEQIIAPDQWPLLPGETLVRTESGDDATVIDLPVADLHTVYVLYASCSGDATMTVETTSVSPTAGEPWQVDCDAVPSRRETHTDDASRTTGLRLIVKGEGPWGFVLANTDAP